MSPKMILVCLSEQELFSYRNAVSSAQEKDCVHRKFMLRFDWWLFTDKYCRVNHICLYFVPNHM